MKTIIPLSEHHPFLDERQDGIFYHNKDVSISWQVRTISEGVQIRDGKASKNQRLTEMPFIVIRFPYHLKADFSSDLSLVLRRVFHFQWEKDGEYAELLLHEGLAVRVFRELEKEGIFKYVIKEYPNAKDARYFPMYRNSSRPLHFLINVATVLVGIPHVFVLVMKEERVRKKRNQFALLKESGN